MVRVNKDEMIADLRAKLAACHAQIDSDYARPAPTRIADRPVNGYTFNAHSKTVCKAWRIGHLFGRERHYDPTLNNGRPINASQMSIPIYETEREAWIALRIEVEQQAKSLLAAMDSRINELGR